jgi:hypothetical protein
MFLSVAVTVPALTTGAYCQASQSPPNAALKEPLKWQVTECQGIDNCTTWAFVNTKGYGKWRTGEEAVLEVVSLKNGNIVVSRTDVTGTKHGLTATYRGTLRSNSRVGGEYESVYEGHRDAGDWYWIVESNSINLPPVMHLCVRCDGGHGGTLVWEDGHYRVVNDVPGQTTILTVEKFTRDLVVLHRSNSGLYPGTAVLTGKISAAGNSITNGVQTYPGGQPQEFHAAWGSAINTVVGSRGPDPVVPNRPITLADVGSAIHTIHEAIDIFNFLAPFFQ